MPLGAGQPASSLATPANVLVALNQSRAPHRVAKNLLWVGLLGSHFSVRPWKDELAPRTFQRMLKVRAQRGRYREYVRVLSFRGLGIVRASNDDESFTKVHILTPKAEQLAFAHSGVDGGSEQVAPIIRYVEEQK
jgi:hypothetical protein